MNTSQQPNFNRMDLSLTENPITPEIAVLIGQSIARMLGWDNNNEIWRKLLTDQDGRLLVSTSVTQGTEVNQAALTVALVSVQLFGINLDRRLMIIQNLGSTPIYVTFGTPAVAATGLQIASGGTFIDDHYLGVVTAIALSGSNDVRLVEF